MISVAILSTLAAAQAADATPIVIREPYPAKIESRTYDFECPGLKAQVNYSRRHDAIFGSIRAASDEKLSDYTSAQASLFDQLGMIDDVSVSCRQDRNAFSLLVSGFSKDGSDEVIYELGYDSEEGFGLPRNILR